MKNKSDIEMIEFFPDHCSDEIWVGFNKVPIYLENNSLPERNDND